MLLTLGFVDIDCAWHYRASGTLPTSFGNKDTLLILHKCIQDETQTYKDSELHGHKPEAAEQQSKRLPTPPANTAYQHKDLERILAAATVIRSSFLCLSLQIKYFTLKREVTCLAFIYSGTAVTQQSAPTLFPSRLKC